MVGARVQMDVVRGRGILEVRVPGRCKAGANGRGRSRGWVSTEAASQPVAEQL